MALIQFVQNYEDLSTDKGFQFKFHCDKCQNGYMTRFQASGLGIAESVLEVAGSLFGGVFRSVSNASYQVQRAVGGPAHDAALEAAVGEGKEHFKQCTRCGRWVCPEVCWNAQAGLCEGCAPNFQVEMAAGQAQAKVAAAHAQLGEKAAKTDYVSGVDLGAGSVLAAPGVSPAGSCRACHAALAAGARFCPQCGAPAGSVSCASCGTALGPNAKFCAQCGARTI